MKLAIITDTHYGARKGSKHLHDYFELFYKNIFFPSLEAEGIDTIIHMGDIFDSRKSIDYYSLEWAKRVVFEPMKKYKVHAITGNHDCYYKNTNEINSPELLLCDYDNITTYSSAQDIKNKIIEKTGFDEVMHVDEGGALTGAMSEYNTIKDNIAQKKNR